MVLYCVNAEHMVNHTVEYRGFFFVDEAVTRSPRYSFHPCAGFLWKHNILFEDISRNYIFPLNYTSLQDY